MQEITTLMLLNAINSATNLALSVFYPPSTPINQAANNKYWY